MAPVISFIAEIVASFPDFALHLACTASTTTMASSTTIPMAKIICKQRCILMENPNIAGRKITYNSYWYSNGGN
jgi:hypothetical protein